MLIAQNLPRNLDWRHAGPLLFGDWGTSRLYVLGFAVYYTGHASVAYLGAMSLVMIAVAWAYTVICRCFPDGGGVYTAARRINPTLSVIGATLLLCNFIVTAAISAVEAMHYLGVPHVWVAACAALTVAITGVINWFGSRSAGRVALVIALVAIALSLVIACLSLYRIPEGIRSLTWTVPGIEEPWDMWRSFVRMILALSGVEAVANMTGMMKQPVASTAKKTIWPVLLEVIILNAIFALVILTLPGVRDITVPDYVRFEVREGLDSAAIPHAVKEYRDTAVKVLADQSASHWFGPGTGRIFGLISGIVFGLLLLSAVNTAVLAMVSVTYALAKDRELPRHLTTLNYSGVPWVGLVAACVMSGAVLFVASDARVLGDLYAVGVVGAIAINVLSCAYNRELDVTRIERAGLWTLGFFMGAAELTIIATKPRATIFAGTVVALVLAFRQGLRMLTPVEPVPEPAAGWMSEIGQTVKIQPGKPRIMLAARGRDNAEYAVDMARRRDATLFTVFIRVLRVMDLQPGAQPRVEDDPQAQEALGTAVVLAKQAGVQCYPIYVTATEIADEILDYTVTFGCDTLIMGKSRRSLFSRAVAGDVVARVAQHLPDGVSLITRTGRAEEPRRDEPTPGD